MSLNKLYIFINKNRPHLLKFLGIFLLGLLLRFLYYPNDISFGYDQARDAYVSLSVVSGDFKILGPPSTFGINHGALPYYIFAPFYIMSKNPAFLAAVLRIVNVLGVFLLFLIVKNISENKVAPFISAFIFAVSFEQSQYALFLGHPALAVPSVLIFYLGLSYLIFKNKKWGLLLAILGLALAIQFHFSMIVLFGILLLMMIFFWQSFKKLHLKTYLKSLGILLITLSTYVLAELKFDFRVTKFFLNILKRDSELRVSNSMSFNNMAYVAERYVGHNISFLYPLAFLLIIFAAFYLMKKNTKAFKFLVIWFLGGFLMYFFDSSSQPTYYYGIGSSVAIIIMTSIVVTKIYKRSQWFAYSILFLIFISNLTLIRKYNPVGTIAEINAQEGMLLSDELNVLDFIYTSGSKDKYSVYALTIPYKVNTTWSYLFNWYGKNTYSYIPIWGGEAAPGYEGYLPAETAQSELPKTRFTIIEPTRGLPASLIDDFLQEENNFWEAVDRKEFGKFTVYKQNYRD
jgi:hypothetical protein